MEEEEAEVVEVEATAMHYLAGEELQLQRSPKEMEEGSGRKILEVATKAEAGRAPDQSKVPEGEDKESLVVVVGGVRPSLVEVEVVVVAAVLRHLQVVQPGVEEVVGGALLNLEEVAAEVEVEVVEDGVHRSLVVEEAVEVVAAAIGLEAVVVEDGVRQELVEEELQAKEEVEVVGVVPNLVEEVNKAEEGVEVGAVVGEVEKAEEGVGAGAVEVVEVGAVVGEVG